jgi:hypothetical protein
MTVAAVAAGTLAVGSAGYALGDRGTGDPTADGGTVGAAITLPGAGTGAAGGGTEAAAGGGPVPEVAADARVGTGTDVASESSLPAWYGGRTVFRAEGLSDDAGTAEAWAYDPAQTFSAQTAALVAAAVGLDGEPRLDGVTWTVGPQDGSGPNLQLQPDGTTTVSFYDPTRDPFACPEPVPLDDVAPEGAGDVPAIEPGAPACPQAGESAPAPTGDAAVAQARELIAATGTDPDGFTYEVQDTGTPAAAYVTAYAVIGGQRTGSMWSITLDAEGVQAFYGALAPLVPLGTYDVVSPAAAVDRLEDLRFGSFLGGPVMAADAPVSELSVGPDGAVADGAVEAPDTTPPATVQPGAAFAWPVVEVALTGARLGLAQHVQPDGATVLVPAYELSSADGGIWSVIAVAEDELDLDPAS